MFVCAVADDSSTSTESSAVEGVCNIGILVYIRFVNVFAAVEELWQRFEIAKGLPCVTFRGCFIHLSLARRAWEESIYLYIPSRLGLID